MTPDTILAFFIGVMVGSFLGIVWWSLNERNDDR